MTVVDLDAATGQPKWQIASAGVSNGGGISFCYPAGTAPQIAVGGDGSAYVVEPTNAGLQSVKVSPAGGTTLISQGQTTITKNGQTINVQCCSGPPMVNTDGNMYSEFEYRTVVNDVITSDTLYLYHSDNAFSPIVLSTTTQNEALLPGPILPDGNGGVMATWTISPSNPPVLQFPYQAADVTNGVVGAPYGLPFSPQSVTFQQSPALVLGENGIAFASGTTTAGDGVTQISQVASFNLTSGATNWTYQAGAGSTLSILGVLSDAGIAVNDSLNGVVRISAAGGASPVTGPLGGLPRYTWSGDWYLQGSQGTAGLTLPLDIDAAAPWATPGGNPGKQSGADSLCECELQTTTSGQQSPAANTIADNGGSVNPLTVANCPICNLSPPSPPTTLTSCTILPASGPTYLIVVGDSGTDHNVHQGFNLAAQQNANDLQSRGNNVIACRISTATDLNNALKNNGHIGGGVVYYGHSGPYRYSASPEVILSILAMGNAIGGDSNLHYYNINEICPNTTCNGILDPNITFTINGCRAAKKVSGDPSDASGVTQTPIAKIIARQLNIRVTGYMVGTYFSLHSAATATSADYKGEPKNLPEALPMYLIPEGPPGNKKAPACFVAVGECTN